VRAADAGIAVRSNERANGDGAGFAPTGSTAYGPYTCFCQLPATASRAFSGIEPSGSAIERIR